jgi:perosamine synthetase
VAANQTAYVLDCLRRNELSYRGFWVPRFEEKLAECLGVKHVVATCNGTLSLLAVYRQVFDRASPWNYVVVPTTTYAATVSQLILAGFTPLYIDCDDGFRADLNQLDDALRRYLVAGVVIPTLYADGPDMSEAVRLCQKRGVPLVEDAAEAFACAQGTKFLGTFGAAGSFSFFANKVVTSGGEGGCVATNDNGVAARVRRFVNQGTVGGYRHLEPGTNARMTAIQAAIGCAQLEDLPTILERKRAIARFYRSNIKFKAVTPRTTQSSEWMPVFQLPFATYEDFRQHCERRGVEVRPTFPPIHQMPGFAGHQPFDLWTSLWLESRHFIVPCFPDLSRTELERVADVVNSYDYSK